MRSIGIYLFRDVELLDFAGPFEVFTTASRVGAREGIGELFSVQAVGATSAPIPSRAGVQLVADITLADAAPPDIFLVPGGVMDEELARDRLLDFVRRCHAVGEVVASVCTGAFVLARAGLLDGRKVTTHWEDLEELRLLASAAKVVEDVRWVDEGDIVTSAGISAGIDMALHLVSRFHGEEFARLVARQMDYAWAGEVVA